MPLCLSSFTQTPTLSIVLSICRCTLPLNSYTHADWLLPTTKWVVAISAAGAPNVHRRSSLVNRRARAVSMIDLGKNNAWLIKNRSIDGKNKLASPAIAPFSSAPPGSWQIHAALSFLIKLNRHGEISSEFHHKLNLINRSSQR